MKGSITGETRTDAIDGARHWCLKNLLTRLSQWPIRLQRGRSQKSSPHTTKTSMHSFHKKPLRKFSAIRCLAGAIAAFSLVAVVSPGDGFAQDKAEVLL